jgi:hypothetical protein
MVTMVGSACAPARMWYTVMSSEVKAFESAPMALMAALYFSVENWARSAEHHVLEEMGKARLARFDFVAAAGAHDGIVGDQPGRIVFDDENAQPVGSVFSVVGKGNALAWQSRGTSWGCSAGLHGQRQGTRCNG